MAHRGKGLGCWTETKGGLEAAAPNLYIASL
jgi:hypothetical protein